MREPKTVAESCQEISDLLEEISVSTTAFIRTHREARIDLRELPGELTKLKTILELLHGDLEAGIAVAPQPLELELAGLVSDLHHVILRAQGLFAGAGETTEQQMSELKALHTLIAAQGSALEITLDLVSVPLVGKDSNVANKIKGSHNDLLGKISKLRTRAISSGAVNTADEKSTSVVCHYFDELAAYLSAINEEVNGKSSQNTSSKASNQNNGHLVNGIGISSASNSNPPDEEHITNHRSSFESELSEADTLHLSSQTRPTLTGNVAANPVYSNSSQGALHSSTQPSVPPPNYSSLTLVEPSQLRARESHRTQTGTAFSRPNLSNWSISAPPAIEYFSLSPDEKLIAYVIPHGVGLTGRTIQVKEVDTGRTVATLPDVPGERLESSTQQPTRADIISERHSLIIVQLPGGRLSLWNYDVTKRGVCGMMDMAAKTNRWKAYTTPGGDEATVVLEKAVRAEAYRPELVRYKIVFSPLAVSMTYRAAFSQRTKRLGFGFGSGSPDDLVVAYHGASSHQPWSSFKPFLYMQTPRNFDQRRLTLLDEDAEPLPTDGWTSSLRRSLLNAPCRVVSCTEHGGRLVVVWKSDPVILGVPAGQPRYVLVVREGDRSGAVELVPPGRQAPNCVVVSPDSRLVAVMGCGSVEVCEIVVSGVSSAATGARAPFTVRMRRALVYETIRAVHGVFLASCKGMYTMEQTGHGRGVVAPFAARFTNLDADTGGSTESGGGSLSHQNREVGLA
ncbi:hypothetical protein MCOR28_004716 [Pyricularia oryzae]|nr:hypothetical protein MCOR26_001864 [Pyricularia oryzae]KAI6343630.1 hypothetical protein MCOR28_004716 [Pyricularia oryzae]KAI6480393.1 hypothetical protein MCOR11_011650 [Pyricularia oryzae]